MRLMVTWYDGNENCVSDIHVDDLDPAVVERALRVAWHEEPAEVSITSAVEVLPGVDYDKEGYAASVGVNPPDFLRMVLK